MMLHLLLGGGLVIWNAGANGVYPRKEGAARSCRKDSLIGGSDGGESYLGNGWG